MERAIWQNNESDISKVGILITKTFYGIDDYYKKYSRTKSALRCASRTVQYDLFQLLSIREH